MFVFSLISSELNSIWYALHHCKSKVNVMIIKVLYLLLDFMKIYRKWIKDIWDIGKATIVSVVLIGWCVDKPADYGPVHKGTNHVPKAVSDRYPLPDWVRDLNYVRSHALQTPVPITNRICALRGNILFLD